MTESRPTGGWGPVMRYHYEEEQLKGEDVIFVHEHLEKLHHNHEDYCHWSLYCVCDGHGGRDAADYIKKHLGHVLIEKLPKGDPPDLNTKESEEWLKRIQTAIIDSFLKLDQDFENQGLPQSVGCTVSLAVVCGWLLTIANIGDSEAFLDVGRRREFELTTSHKLDTNVNEQARLERVGKVIRPLSKDLFQPAEEDEEGVGPLRVWPCGLAVSRSVGDYDCGCEVTAAPHIRQIEVPLTGCRLIVASDGLWDHVTGRRAMREARKHRIEDAPRELIRLVEYRSRQGLTDDTSVLVLDLLPKSGLDFRDVVKQLRRPKYMFKRLKERWRGQDAGVVPRMVGDIDGVSQGSCALVGPPPPMASEVRLSPPKLEHQPSQRKYMSQQINPVSGLDIPESGSDSDDSVEERREALEARTSGLTKSEAQRALATRRVLSIDEDEDVRDG